MSFPGSRTQRVQDLGLSTSQYMVVVLWQETATGIQICPTLIPLALLETLLLVANLPAQHGPSGCLLNLAGMKILPSQKFQLSRWGRRTKRGRLVMLPPAWQWLKMFPWQQTPRCQIIRWHQQSSHQQQKRWHGSLNQLRGQSAQEAKRRERRKWYHHRWRGLWNEEPLLHPHHLHHRPRPHSLLVDL